MSENFILSEMNAHILKKAVNKHTIAILIFGACENHGDHMPFGADFIMPYELAKRVALRQKNIIIFPPLPYGVSSHHKDFFMTVSLEPSTMISIIHDILQCLVDNKIKRILIINGHDGNVAPIDLASKLIKEKEKNKDVVISCLESWWVLVGSLVHDNFFDVWDGLGHGGEAETSAMLAVNQDLVDMRLAPEQTVPTLPKDIRIYWLFSELSKTGSTGGARNATLEKGRKILAILEDKIIEFINEMNNNDWKYGIRKEKLS